MIFRGTGDGTVMALDAETGKLIWQTQGANPTRHETFVSAPIAWDGKVFIGIGISDLDIVGRLMAFDAKTGKVPTLGLAKGTPPRKPLGRPF